MRKSRKTLKNGTFLELLNDPDFFRKIRPCHFFTFIIPYLHAKNQKNPRRGYRDIRERTDGHFENITQLKLRTELAMACNGLNFTLAFTLD